MIDRNKISVFFLLLTSCLISLGQLQRIPLTAFTSIYVHEVVLGLWTLFLLTSSTTRNHFTSFVLRTTRLVAPLLVLILVGWTSALLTGTSISHSLLYAARLCFYLSWAAVLAKSGTLSKQWLHLSLISTGLLIAFFGLLQRIFFADTRSLAILGWDDHYLRLISTQLDPNFTGILLVMTIFSILKVDTSFWQWLIHGQTQKSLSKIARFTTWFCICVLLAALALTYSRASILALIIGLIYYLATHRAALKNQAKMLMIGAAIFGGVIFGTSLLQSGEGTNLFRTSTVFSRLQTSQYWLMSLQPHQWIVGRGLFVAPADELVSSKLTLQDHANLPDSLPVLILSGTGLLGTALTLYYLKRYIPYFKRLSPAESSLLIAVLVHSMANNTLLQVFVLMYVLLSLLSEELTPRNKS